VSDLPIPYEIDSSTQTVYAAVGPWTAEAVRSWVELLLNDPAYVPGMRGMINLRFAAGPIPNARTLKDIAEALSPLTAIPIRTRWAFLVGTIEMHFRVRLLESLTSAGYIQFRSFDDEKRAFDWLGVETIRNPWLRRI
jgi:hypothetical protein